MTKKDKLLKYFCMALPYGVKFLRTSWNYEWDQEISVVETLEDIDNERYINHTRVYKVEDIKPYLRPMSSMTEEEMQEYELLANRTIVSSVGFVHLEAAELIEWLLKKHFDFLSLIPMGSAIEVTEENNPYKD